VLTRLPRNGTTPPATGDVPSAAPADAVVDAPDYLFRDLRGAASLQATNPVTGFVVWDQNWSVLLINYAQVASYTNNRIDIVLSSPPSGPVHVGYQFDNYQSASSPVRDSSDVFIPGRGQPLLPCIQWFNTSN